MHTASGLGLATIALVALASCGNLEGECWIKLEATAATTLTWTTHTPYSCQSDEYSGKLILEWLEGAAAFTITVHDYAPGATGPHPAEVKLRRGATEWVADVSHCTAEITLDALIEESSFRQLRGNVSCLGQLGPAPNVTVAWPVPFSAVSNLSSSIF